MTEEEIKVCTKTRSSYKGQVTSFSNYLASLNVSSLDSSNIRELEYRIIKLEKLYTKFDEVQLRLECISDMEVQLSERESFEKAFFHSLTSAQALVEKFNSSKNKGEECNASCTSHSEGSKAKLVKLPTIQLPKFNGSYENWLEFRDTFGSLIHDNDDIETINKFHYLRSSLEGSAAVVLHSVEFSSSNYKIAWQLLCERFDNKRLLIQNHMTSLFNIDPITRESSHTLKRLIDHINKNLRALASLSEPVNHWDTILIFFMSQKLDSKALREWEELKSRLDKNAPILFSTFLEFLRNRADLIETLELSAYNNNQSSKSTNKIKGMVAMQSARSSIISCPKCNGNHYLSTCTDFLSMSNAERRQIITGFKVCQNCFRTGHYANQCKRTGCKLCRRKHNILLHLNETKGDAPSTVPKPYSSGDRAGSVSADTSTALSPSNKIIYSACAKIESASSDVLLSTALVKVYDVDNCVHIVRAVLDSGSTSCLITTKLCKQLKLPVVNVDRSILGINNSLSQVSEFCRVRMNSLSESFTCDLNCFVLPCITENVPSNRMNLKDFIIPSNIRLADPNFYVPSAVDLIIGADVFWDVLGTQKLKLGVGQPILFETRLGWLVSGPINIVCSSSRIDNNIYCNFGKVACDSADDYSEIQSQLAKFWQVEEVSSTTESQYSVEEIKCEEHFVKNTTRLDNGRFCVRVPLKDSIDVLGDSWSRAKRCLLSLERRNEKQPTLDKMYKSFMSEYLTLGHMSECQVDPKVKGYFIPHHGVLRESSATTKLRVVFNASSPTSSGVSLNRIQMVGPTVQDDLFSILLRFRFYKFIISADVEKMYRQVLVHPEDRHLQQILWRDSISSPFKIYKLNTVTYGTASAPFLATRCLKQLGLDCADHRIRDVILHDFFVDDLLTGADDLGEIQSIRYKVTEVLESACMTLRKWKSNEPTVVSDGTKSVDLNVGSHELSKTLGLGWQTESDMLHFPMGLPVYEGKSKREILSVIAQIFDPLGLLAPCVIRLKIILQQLWLHKLSWDEPLPLELEKQWSSIANNLGILFKLEIPRRVLCDNYKRVDLHIFSDASERAYGACIYVRSYSTLDSVLVRLLVAKSRVAPIKPTTIPRLELLGALLGVRLYQRAINSLRIQVGSTTFWTDSTIVLGWLKMLPSKLQPFVRNRVAQILEATDNCSFRHVPTDQNPADLVSRGVEPQSMGMLDLWWSGPDFLKQDPSLWPSLAHIHETLPEMRPEVMLHVKFVKPILEFNRFSNFLRLQRTVAYVLRYVDVVMKRKCTSSSTLSLDELQNALNFIIRIVQKESFPEYDMLMNNKQLPTKSPLLKLNVFLDKECIMRVGGRLDNSSFTYDKKHPIILQSTHYFTKLLFTFEHIRLLHAGPQLLLATLRETYWPIGGRNLAKLTYRKCHKCCRMKGQVASPQMGNLPPNRILPDTYPFCNVGMDYAGPIQAVSRQGRGCKAIKVYIAIFICLSTKCIHLELVSSLTSNCFLLALRRFISRRGKPANLYSDNGTSFVGAHNDLSKFLKDNASSLSTDAANEEINFHFIPAYAPHFGGLWEAGVKSTKYHLVRVLGHCNLTYEELITTLVQIEAVLNSRPLTPLSSDPADLTPLTPGHFIIGRPLTCLPSKDMRDHTYNHLHRFHRIEQLRQHFWDRWSKEYIYELQTRTKWRTTKASLKLNAMVLIKEDNLPPLKWKLGRIVAVYPGSDGINRVADVRVSGGIIRRAFSKICPLPED